MDRLLSVFLAITVLVMASCRTASNSTADTLPAMNRSAEQYVKLVLAMGEHDADYVDAFYGPPEWRAEVKRELISLDEIRSRGGVLADELRALRPPASDRLVELRHNYLLRQTEALLTRARYLAGTKMSFDEESKALYDAVAPRRTEAEFEKTLVALEGELPGTGPLSGRMEAFRKDFIIPKEKLDEVFRAAIDGCRARTLRHIDLPAGESFTVEYVTNKSWSGYNWYQGNFKSLIQVNTDLPIYIDRAVDLACHEGYPGHHVYNVLLEKNLVKDRGWVEFSVYPLFSPQSLIAEGSANYGIDVAFPQAERIEFEKRVLFPLAGLEPSRVERYYRIQELISKLSYAGNEAARRYLDGQITADQAAEYLVKYGLYAPDRARQRIRFMDQYRSYVINYNLGKDLVREHVESKAGEDAKKRWDIFREILSTPTLPSRLVRR